MAGIKVGKVDLNGVSACELGLVCHCSLILAVPDDGSGGLKRKVARGLEVGTDPESLLEGVAERMILPYLRKRVTNRS